MIPKIYLIIALTEGLVWDYHLCNIVREYSHAKWPLLIKCLPFFFNIAWIHNCLPFIFENSLFGEKMKPYYGLLNLFCGFALWISPPRHKTPCSRRRQLLDSHTLEFFIKNNVHLTPDSLLMHFISFLSREHL